MSTPYLSEIRIFSFNFPPKGWAMCNGQTLPINQNQALFALLGTTYGGDGKTNFALPDLQGRSPLHNGTSNGTGFTLGEIAGEATVTLLNSQMPAHNHMVNANGTAAGQTSPAGNYWGNGGQIIYFNPPPPPPPPNTLMNPAAIATVGGSQPHENMSPFLVLNFCIAMTGIFPSRN